MTKVELVQSQLEAYSDLDIDRFCSHYHHQVKVILFENNTVLIDGIAEFREVYENLFNKHPHQRCELKSRVINAETIVDKELITGRETNPAGLYATLIYEFRDNLIDKVWVA